MAIQGRKALRRLGLAAWLAAWGVATAGEPAVVHGGASWRRDGANLTVTTTSERTILA